MKRNLVWGIGGVLLAIILMSVTVLVTLSITRGSKGIGGAQVGGSASYVVAANDAPALVKAQADYLCDGIDDQLEINAALEASGNQGCVQLSQGTFYCSDSIVFPAWIDAQHTRDQLTLAGVGVGTRIQAISTMTTDLIALQDKDDNTTIRNLWVRGSRAQGQTAGSGITALGETGAGIHNGIGAFTLEHINVSNFPDYGIEAVSAQLFWTDVKSGGNGKAGAYIDFTPSPINPEGYIQGCKVDSNLGQGFYCISAQDLQVTGLYAIANAGSGMAIYNCARLMLSGVTDGNGKHGAQLWNNTGCIFNIIAINNSQEQADTYSGIFSQENNKQCSFEVISYCDNAPMTQLQKYGFEEYLATSSNCTLVNSHAWNNVRGQIVIREDAPYKTTVVDSVGYTPP